MAEIEDLLDVSSSLFLLFLWGPVRGGGDVGCRSFKIVNVAF